MKRVLTYLLTYFLLIFALLAIYSCGKDDVTAAPIFTEKPIFIENHELATAKVKEFLNHTDISEITLRSEFPDTEVNEGLWTLEAASNYVDNVNIVQKTDTIIDYDLTIVNLVDGEVVKMSGVDMVDKFNQLQASITAEEAASGKTAKIVDFKFNAVSDQQSDLEVGVVFGVQENVDGCEDWPASESIFFAGDHLNPCILSALDNLEWYQTVSNIENPSLCYEDDEVVMYEILGDTMEPDDFDEAYAAAQDMIACFYSTYLPSPSNPITTTPYIFGDRVVTDIELFGDKLPFSEYGFIWCFRASVVYGVPYDLN